MEKGHKKSHKIEKKCVCKEEIATLKKQTQEYLEGWQRAQADYANFKRRAEEDIIKTAKFASENLIKKILPVLDNFQRAFNHMPAGQTDSEWIKGIKQVGAQLENVLKEEGLEKIDCIGKDFNPEEAEAIGFDQNQKFKEDQVSEIIQEGYKLKDKIIRPAKVKIATQKAQKETHEPQK